MLAALNSVGYGQSSLLNNSFENWTDVVVKDSIELWHTSNEQLASQLAPPNCIHVPVGAHDGTYMVYLETVLVWNEFSLSNDTVFGYIIKEDAPSGNFIGFPYSDTVDVFKFWYQCNVMPGDSAICIVELRKAGAAYSTNIYKMGGVPWEPGLKFRCHSWVDQLKSQTPFSSDLPAAIHSFPV